MCTHIPSHAHKHLLACSLSLTHLTSHKLSLTCVRNKCVWEAVFE